MRTRALTWCIALAGCNQLFGLDPTVIAPGEADPDRDEVPDVDDNCPSEPNTDQSDRDGDLIGDVCDVCPDDATTQHDEDGDGRGDPCDLCPGQIDPEQGDGDGDGVGDVCEYIDDTLVIFPTTPVMFDSFVTLDPAWTAAGVAWQQTGEAIAVTGPATLTDQGLRRMDVVLPQTFIVEVGFRTTRDIADGDRIAVGVVDALGNEVSRCELRADTVNGSLRVGITVLPTTGPYDPDIVTAPAGALRRLRLAFVNDSAQAKCQYIDMGLLEDKTDGMAKIPADVRPVIYGSTAVEITYFEAWRR